MTDINKTAQEHLSDFLPDISKMSHEERIEYAKKQLEFAKISSKPDDFVAKFKKQAEDIKKRVEEIKKSMR